MSHTFPFRIEGALEAIAEARSDYQRPAVWSSGQKQLLVDSILRGYDVPKFYWRQVNKKPVMYDVVDGQQKIRAICEFCEGKYGLPKDADPIDGYEIKNLRYADLPHELRIKWDPYNLDVVVMDAADEDETREMFLRLQNGTSLKAQEKRNAMPGNMRDFVKTHATHSIFSVCGFNNSSADELKSAADRGEPDDGSQYYEHWLAAFEGLVTAKGLSDPAAMLARKEAWADAYRHTPHGKPVELFSNCNRRPK